MSASLFGVERKLQRAITHIHNLEQQIRSFRDLQPYSVRVQEDLDALTGQPVGRLIAVKNAHVADPDVGLVLLAGEAIYQMRSALDHMVHQLVILNGQATKLTSSRRHQFPVFENPQGYAQRAAGMIDGVSASAAKSIAAEQPYVRSASAPSTDPLWMLQDLNNTDKHRLIPVSVVGIGEIRGRDSGSALFSLTSEDLVLEDGKMLWSFTTPSGRYDDVHAELSCAIAFEQAMTLGTGITMSMHGILWRCFTRVDHVVGVFRPLF
jgi:hypothetical protein